MYKNMYSLRYIFPFLANYVKMAMSKIWVIILRVQLNILFQVINNLNSYTQPGCPWVEIHTFYFHHQRQV